MSWIPYPKTGKVGMLTCVFTHGTLHKKIYGYTYESLGDAKQIEITPKQQFESDTSPMPRWIYAEGGSHNTRFLQSVYFSAQPDEPEVIGKNLYEEA